MNMREIINLLETPMDGDAQAKHELGQRILAFIDAYAKIAAAYDPEYDDPSERFNGPDSALLAMAGESLVAGKTFPKVLSSYGSGCYKDWANKQLTAEHNELVQAANQYALDR